MPTPDVNAQPRSDFEEIAGADETRPEQPTEAHPLDDTGPDDPRSRNAEERDELSVQPVPLGDEGVLIETQNQGEETPGGGE